MRALTVLGAAAVFLSGCVTPPPQAITLNHDNVAEKSGRIGVVMTPLPKVDTQFPGAGCLLCIAAANMAHTSLTAHTQTLPNEDVTSLKNEMADLVRKRGGTPIVIAEDLKLDELPDFTGQGVNIALKDHSGLKKRYDVDKLLVINITRIGIERNYSAYVPTGAPNGIFQGEAYLINLSSNTFEWLHRVRVLRAADGNWDEPPKFPGLTNAFFQALENGKDEFKKPFIK